MRKAIGSLLVVGLLVGSLVGTAEAKKKKPKKPPAPVPVDVAYFLLGGCETSGGLTLSTTNKPSEEAGCGNPFYGLFAPTGQAEDAQIALAIDGLPLTLDASKPVTGVVKVDSYVLANEAPAPMGVGAATLELVLAGTSGGEEVPLGETTVDYTVTPAQIEYEVEFEIALDPALNNKLLDGLSLSLKNSGNSAFHGAYDGDGSTSFTIGAFQTP